MQEKKGNWHNLIKFAFIMDCKFLSYQVYQAAQGVESQSDKEACTQAQIPYQGTHCFCTLRHAR